MGSIVPPEGYSHNCGQIYILDEAMQLEARRGLRWGSELHEELMQSLAEMLRSHDQRRSAFPASWSRTVTLWTL